MKFLAEIEHTTVTYRNEMLLTLKIGNRAIVEKLKNTFKKGDIYSNNMRDIDSDRSLKQNRLLWKLIGEINEAMNASTKAVDDEEIYVNALIDSGACVETLQGTIQDLVDETRNKSIRKVEMIEDFRNGKARWRIYPGSSGFTKKEMGVLIDHVLDIAAQLELDIFYWRNRFYG